MTSLASTRRRKTCPKACRETDQIDPQRAQHLDLTTRAVLTDDGLVSVLVNDCESPLAWLARRKGRDGRPLISAEQFLAGERLRAEFTRAQMSPRVTSSWEAPSGRSSGGGAGEMTDLIVASRQRMQQAMAASGPEFSGLLIDVCCFLRGLEDVERERGWPPRSGKVVLQLALDRLARHYGLSCEARGRDAAGIRSWAR